MDNSIYSLQIFIKRINEELYKLRSYMNNTWSYNNNCKINRANSLLIYIDLLRGGLTYT